MRKCFSFLAGLTAVHLLLSNFLGLILFTGHLCFNPNAEVYPLDRYNKSKTEAAKAMCFGDGVIPHLELCLAISTIRCITSCKDIVAAPTCGYTAGPAIDNIGVSMSQLATFAEEEHYSIISLDDGKANALGFAMCEAINTSLDAAETAGKVTVIAGRPGKFSAGFDLKVMGQGGDDMVRLLHTGADLSRRLLQFPYPVVLAVSGHALAMGALLTLSADYRIGIKGPFKIGLNEVAIGMTLPYFGLELARARLQPPHFETAVGLARLYDADGAVDAGFLDEAVAPDDLLARATELAQQLATLDMKAHRGSKARVREPLLAALSTAFEREQLAP